MELIPNVDEAAYIRRMSRPSHPGVTPAPQHNTKELVTDIRKTRTHDETVQSGRSSLRGPDVKRKDQGSGEEGPAEIILLVDRQKIWAPAETLTNFYQYSSQLWLHDVVLQLHLRGEKSPAVDHQDCIKDHRCFSPTPGKDSVYSAWLIKRAKKIISNYSHPGHPLFSTFPSAGSGSDGHGQKD